jgi:hypothetical protein
VNGRIVNIPCPACDSPTSLDDGHGLTHICEVIALGFVMSKFEDAIETNKASPSDQLSEKS